MYKNRWVGMVLALLVSVLLSSLSGSAALAEDAVVLSNETPISGELVGATGEAFAYYQINYPGDGADVTVTAYFAGVDRMRAKDVGFNVYGGNLKQGNGVSKENGAYSEFSYSESDPVLLTVQIYNYGGQTLAYTIVAEGLHAQPPEGEAVTAATEELQQGPVVYTVTGNAGGAYGKHDLEYAGTEEDVTVTMILWPTDPVLKNAVGFKVYDPSGKQVGMGQANSAHEREGTFASDVAGDYLILVYNYAEGVDLNYILEISN